MPRPTQLAAWRSVPFLDSEVDSSVNHWSLFLGVTFKGVCLLLPLSCYRFVGSWDRMITKAAKSRAYSRWVTGVQRVDASQRIGRVLSG